MEFGKLLKENIIAIMMGIGGIISLYINIKLGDAENLHHREMMIQRIETLENRLEKKIKIINELEDRVNDIERCK